MNFISETDVEAAKKKRAEEWEEARAAGRKLRKLSSYTDGWMERYPS